jgi:hypothetical protein
MVVEDQGLSIRSAMSLFCDLLPFSPQCTLLSREAIRRSENLEEGCIQRHDNFEELATAGHIEPQDWRQPEEACWFLATSL